MSHTIMHFEIPADDVEKLAEFYRKIFGWKIEKLRATKTTGWYTLYQQTIKECQPNHESTEA